MNKKGFTLVELLATITILGLLALLASTSVTKVLKESKGDLYTTQIKLVESAAEAWGAENIDKLPNEGECKFLTIETLQDYGLIDKDITNPKTNEKIDNNIKIKISSSKTGYGNSVTNYEVNPKSIEGCSHAMPCELIEGEPNTIGSKYECEVKPKTKYNFYVLSHEDDGSTNLIMDRNMCSDGTPTDESKEDKCLVAWNNESGQSTKEYGPVTAMTYLNNATSTWENIDNLDLTYDDEGGSFTDFVLNGKARLPYKSEVANSNGINEYLYEYLDGSLWEGSGTQPTNHISDIDGYWTLSSFADNFNWAIDVFSSGFVSEYEVEHDDLDGVRPVINAKL